MQDHSPQALVNQLNKLVVRDDLNKDAKKEAGAIARRLWLELEEPGELIIRTVFQIMDNAMLNLSMDLGIHEYLARKNDVVSTEEIAKALGVDVVLMQRIMRNLAAVGHVEEVDASAYRAGKFSRAFATTGGIAAIKCCCGFAAPAWTQIPAYLKSNNYQNPTDPMNTPLQQAWQSDKHFFELLVERDMLDDFQTFMSVYRLGRAEFLDVFPAEDRLLPGGPQSDDDVLMVDIGGGHGHELEAFVKKFPEKKGRMILQDQANVVSEVNSKNLEAMTYDFFTPQPIKGARAYYFRMIFHDWPDKECLAILQNVIPAMKPGYSKLIINDVVLPEKGAGRFPTQSDLIMMSLFAASERTEPQWRALLEKAGITKVKVWYGDPESVIEAEI